MNALRLAMALVIGVAVVGSAWTSRSEPAERPALGPMAAGAGQNVSCAYWGKGSPTAHERQMLRTAPEGAKRTSAHVLTVRYKDGIHSFVDKRPYREELSGFHWTYCGYLPILGAHLIGMEDEDLFTGKLLVDGDGRVIDGGQTVYPSPDGKLFLAESQVDGEELSHWVLSDLAGRRLWVSESGITKKDLVLQEFEAPHWISDNAIQVSVTCGDRAGTKGKATLTRDGNVWRWKSSLHCLE